METISTAGLINPEKTRLCEGPWLESRKVGGSDISTLMGLNPWSERGALEVYDSKVNGAQIEQTPAMEFGHAIEPMAIGWASRLTGYSFQGFGKTCFASVRADWETASPDALALASPEPVWGLAESLLGRRIPPERLGLEVKCTTSARRAEWGEALTDEIPPGYWAQIQWCLNVLDRDFWLCLVVFRDTCTSELYLIERDDEAIAAMRAVAADFWQNHVEPRKPPMADQYGRPSWPPNRGKGRVRWRAVASSAFDFMRREAGMMATYSATMADQNKDQPMGPVFQRMAETAAGYVARVETFARVTVEENRTPSEGGADAI